MPITNSDTDRFYPVHKIGPLQQVGWVLKIREHLRLASRGDRERESRLCNRLGSLRRSSNSFNELTPNLRDAVSDAIKFLRQQGRVVDFKQTDPAKWITMRGGKPRW